MTILCENINSLLWITRSPGELLVCPVVLYPLITMESANIGCKVCFSSPTSFVCFSSSVGRASVS